MFTMVPYRRYVSRPVKPFESFLNDPFFRSFFNSQDGQMNGSFRVDIREMDDAFVIEAEMPGLTEENINLEVDEGMLTIIADFNTQTQEENAGRMYCERRSGHMERSFNLDNIDAENINANLKNGILYVNLPKVKPVEKTARKIPVLVENTEAEQN